MLLRNRYVLCQGDRLSPYRPYHTSPSRYQVIHLLLRTSRARVFPRNVEYSGKMEAGSRCGEPRTVCATVQVLRERATSGRGQTQAVSAQQKPVSRAQGAAKRRTGRSDARRARLRAPLRRAGTRSPAYRPAKAVRTGGRPPNAEKHDVERTTRLYRGEFVAVDGIAEYDAGQRHQERRRISGKAARQRDQRGRFGRTLNHPLAPFAIVAAALATAGF
ncbi:hypothetical protein GGS23DRAFT_7320 [Durotheca rogersii]|uniref:uncharacterized protein n=1 Tax=Durotheca rogersii TaxID=419775 RepID=UPI0022204E7E|nr:uncharacterized protein GGS23DRAFT_7320 [Durotheca rogersii]KAI5868015.1 hypothetical protein GGS23DRAFT_7320 [Durotheca rogersii]